MASADNRDSIYAATFAKALVDGDEDSALFLLESGLVTFRSPIIDGNGQSWTALRVAITHGRERVARTLVRLGADIDEVHHNIDSHGARATSAGMAILQRNASKLSLCHRLGASMARVYRQPDSGTETALELAIRAVLPSILICLLDVVNPERPISLSEDSLALLCLLARRSGPVFSIFKILGTRGFDFRVLGAMCKNLYDIDEDPGPEGPFWEGCGLRVPSDYPLRTLCWQVLGRAAMPLSCATS